MTTTEEAIQIGEKALEVGLPLVTKILGMISDARAAKGEAHDAIVARLEAADAALEQGAPVEHQAAEAEWDETQALIDQLKTHADHPDMPPSLADGIRAALSQLGARLSAPLPDSAKPAAMLGDKPMGSSER